MSCVGEASARRSSGDRRPNRLRPTGWAGDEIREAGPRDLGPQDQPSLVAGGAKGGIGAGEPEAALGEGLYGA